ARDRQRQGRARRDREGGRGDDADVGGARSGSDHDLRRRAPRPRAVTTIRRAEARDLPVLGRLGALLMRTHYDFDPQRFMDPGTDPAGGYAWFLGKQLKDDDAVIFVAEQDGT